MADFANAFVRFKIKPQYKEAFETILKKQKRNQSKYFDWFDYFNFITTDGKIKTSNPYGENEYLSLEGMGINTNFFGEYSEKDACNKIDGDIVSIKMCKKWCAIDGMERIISSNLDEIADEVYFCQLVAYDKNDEKYYKVTYNVSVIPDEDYPEYKYTKLMEINRELYDEE